LKNLNCTDILNNSINIQYNSQKGLVRGVKLNRTFFAIRHKKEIDMAKNNTYLKTDFCKKNCGEKLFKNLDLSQRYYLNKGNTVNMHSVNCPINLKENLHIRSTSIPTSHREKRKININNNDDSILNVSFAKSTTNGVLDYSNLSHKVNF